MDVRVLDRTWVRSSFFHKDPSDPRNRYNRSHSTSGLYKFQDTSLGGNEAINCPYSRTRFADIAEKRIVPVGFGMGRKYSEMIDDNQVVGHFRPGVQTFNGLLSFFSNSYNYRAGKYINTGRSTGWFYTAGKMIGIASGFMVPSVLVVGLAGRVIAGLKSSRFYSIKSTTYAYWQAVNNIVNTIASGMSIVMPPSSQDRQRDLTDSESAFNAHQMAQQVKKMLPTVWTQSTTADDFGIDIYSISSRYQRLAGRFNTNLAEYLSKQESIGALSSAILTNTDAITQIAGQSISNSGGGYGAVQGGIKEYINSFFRNDPWASADSKENQVGSNLDKSDPSNPAIPPMATPDTMEYNNSFYASRQKDFSLTPSSTDGAAGSSRIVAQANDASEWFSLRLDGTESVSESFSNSAGESGLSSIYNGVAEKGRSWNFNFAGGQVLGNVVDSVIGGALGAVKDLVGGFTDGVGISGLVFGMVNGSKIDIPLDYQSSSVSLPTANIKMELRAVYANPLSCFQDLIVPTAMALAIALPRSTGRSTYGSPFLFEYFCRGRNTIRIGMIESLSITRGTSNVKWTREGRPLGIDVNMTIKDLSPIMHMPVSLSDDVLSYINPMEIAEKVIYGQEGAFQDYMDTLAGLSLPQMIYKVANWSRNWMKLMKDYDTKFDLDNVVTWAMNETPLELLKIISAGTSRR